MDPLEEFEQLKRENVHALGADEEAQRLSLEWLKRVTRHRYSYHFSWLGVPIIQIPQDIVAMQEIIWRVRPDLIIETGIAHGGSIVFYASMMELLGGNGHVLGVDVDIRAHNRRVLENHPMRRRYTLLEASSTSEQALAEVRRFAAGRKTVLVCLDSNHTHEHVLNELRCYSPFVTRGSYLVVFDTIVERFDPGSYPDRPWDKGNNPFTAVQTFLGETDRFEVDREIDARLMVSVAPQGYLKRVR